MNMKSAYRKSKEGQGPANVSTGNMTMMYSQLQSVVIALILLSWDGPRKSKKVHFHYMKKTMAPLAFALFYQLIICHFTYIHTHMKVTKLICIILISHLHQPFSIWNLQSNYFYPSEQKTGEREREEEGKRSVFFSLEKFSFYYL